MNRRFAAVPVLAAAVLSLAACSTTGGTPTPAGGGPAQTGTAPTSGGGSTGGGTSLSSLQPCSLISSSEAANLHLSAQGPDNSASAPSCDWQKPVDTNGQNGYSVGATIWASQGLGDVNTSGYSVTSVQLGGHQGKQLAATAAAGNCLVAIGVSDSSRVDITVNAGTDTNQACQVANQVAQAVAPELPAS